MEAPQLEALWEQLSAQLGALQSFGPGQVFERDQYHVPALPAEFSNGSFLLEIALTDSLGVSGFYIRPPAPPPYETPPYADESRFEESDASVGDDPWILPGTWTIPAGEGPFPVIVLIHGSGPNDRDETIGGSRPFKDLAWGLATAGIAVLRYDKRTQAHSASVPRDIGLDEEVIDDALAALEVARTHPSTDDQRVFLLGHSLGGMLAPEVATRDGELAGIAVLAAPARPFFDVLLGQLEYLSELVDPEDPSSLAQMDSIIGLVRGVESGGTSDQEVVLGAPPPYWREVASVDPIGTAESLSIPITVLQGGRDYQSTVEDFQLWVEALGDKPKLTTRLYQDLNHLFISGTGMATPEEYTVGAGHVAEEVVQDLAVWILGQGGS
jgi:alpha-beta hydrolase superfamily lysophospholipase